MLSNGWLFLHLRLFLRQKFSNHLDLRNKYTEGVDEVSRAPMDVGLPQFLIVSTGQCAPHTTL